MIYSDNNFGLCFKNMSNAHWCSVDAVSEEHTAW